MCLQLRDVGLDLAPHVLRAAPKCQHVVAVREARHGPTSSSAAALPGLAGALLGARERLPSTCGAAAAATGAGEFATRRQTGSKGRVSGLPLGRGAVALLAFNLASRAVRCRYETRERVPGDGIEPFARHTHPSETTDKASGL